MILVPLWCAPSDNLRLIDHVVRRRVMSLRQAFISKLLDTDHAGQRVGGDVVRDCGERLVGLDVRMGLEELLLLLSQFAPQQEQLLLQVVRQFRIRF